MVWPPLTWGRGRSQPPPSSHPHPLLLLTPDPDPESEPHMPNLSSFSLLTSLHISASPPSLFSPQPHISQPFSHLLTFHILVLPFTPSPLLCKIENIEISQTSSSRSFPCHLWSFPSSPPLSLTSTHSPLPQIFSPKSFSRFTLSLSPPPDICVSLQNGKLNYFIIFKTLSLSAMP